MPPLGEVVIHLEIERQGATILRDQTPLTRMVRGLDELIAWLGRDNLFVEGVILLTGTGVVPPDDFTLQPGDVVTITADGIGTLVNPVIQGSAS